MQTRVILKVLHPKHGFAVLTQDRGARFRDAEHIKLITDELVADAKRRHGEHAKIKIETRET